MIHPSFEVCYISAQKGYGLIAGKHIPRGTITFVQDDLDIVVTPHDARMLDPKLRHVIDRFSYQDRSGNHIISWDHGKYMNHCCTSNTLTCGYGFEIAVEDIEKGTEVTDDYRIFALNHSMNIDCHLGRCENSPSLAKCIEEWDNRTFPALSLCLHIDQPLLHFIDPEVLGRLNYDAQNGGGFPSVEGQVAFDIEEAQKNTTDGSVVSLLRGVCG